MTTVTYEPEMTMREARAMYFRENGFGETGGYDDDWVDFKLGPVPFPFPNVPARKKAVKVHDLHHILTGYATDIVGEFEISAWEIGAGCKDVAAAWFLNLGGMAGGAVVAPCRTFRAFVRGRRTESLYGRDLEAMLASTVRELRAETRADAPPERATVVDVVGFAGAVAAGFVVGTIFFAMGIVLAPLALAAGLVKRGGAKSAS